MDLNISQEDFAKEVQSLVDELNRNWWAVERELDKEDARVVKAKLDKLTEQTKKLNESD